MALKVPDASEIRILDLLTAAWGSLVLRLFANNYTPTDGDTAGSYTEASFPGYASSTIISWTAAATVSGRATSYGPLHTFAATGGGGGNVYGYYVTDGSGNLMWAERDASAPIDMNSNGKTYSVTPVFTGKTEF